MASQKIHSVFTRIFTAVLIPLLGVSIFLCVSISGYIEDNVEQSTRQTLFSFSEDLSARIEHQIKTVADALNSTRNRLQTLDFDSANATVTADGHIFTLLTSVPDIYNVWFAFAPGTFYSSNFFTKSYLKDSTGIREIYDVTEETLADRARSAWFHIPYLSGADYYKSIDPYNYQIGEGVVYIVTIAFPIVQNGKIVGCVGADLRYERMLDYIRSLKVLGKERPIYLLSPDRDLIYASQDAAELPRENVLASSSQIRQAIETGSVMLFDAKDARGEEKIVCIAPVSIDKSDKALLLYTEMPLSLMRAPAHDLITSILYVLAAAFVIVSLCAFGVARSIARELRKIRKKAQEIAEGKLDVDFSQTAEKGLSLEVSALNNALRAMVQQLTEIHELKIAAVKAEFEREKLETAALAKSRFFATMSHEIRTPMNAITGLSELLLNGDLNEKQRRYVQDIKLSSGSLLKLINDILDSAKMEAGKFELVPANYNLLLMLDNLCSIIELMAGGKGLEFSFTHIGEIPPCLYGDVDRLRQVLLNLLNNAVKYTKHGKVSFRMTNEGSTLLFEVTDTGIGIKPETLPIIFDPYSQVGGKDAAQIEGTGLGLNITQKLVEMMDGSVGVASEYGKGSTFYARIPLIPGNQEEFFETTQAQNSAAQEWNAHVLVVDDNHLNLVVAEGLLSMFGVTCDLALSGAEAIQLVQCNHYSIVFMDQMMPEMDGLETTQAIRELGEEYTTLPIIALTANALTGARETLMEAGMDDFLSKPIEIGELQRLLDHWLSEKTVYAAAS
ncbi:response regulator [Desulfovibrio sp. OttesenSCG-928-I05]|nr:response regulator [Desulfovibrio sp. OttesenSCG-928-I05]